MTRATMRLIRILVVAVAAVSTGCGEPVQQPIAADSRPDLVWPPPPLQPRIRFVKTLSTAKDAGIQKGFFGSIVEFLKGVPEKRLSSPYGIDKDADGRLYVVDTVQKAVAVYDQRNMDHYWFPSSAIEGFVNPIGVAVADDGRVFVSDTQTNVVHIFGERGKRYLGAIGKHVLGRPTGLAIREETGELLVADTLSSQIVVFDLEKRTASKFVGREGETADTFHYPTNIAVSADGTIYVTDSLNYRIQVLDSNFAFRRSFGRPGDAPGYFSRPKGVAVDSDGHVYVVDALFDNVQIFDREGRLLLAFGSPGSAPGNFWLPTEIVIDAEDRIYVSDAYNKRIQVFQYLKDGDAQ